MSKDDETRQGKHLPFDDGLPTRPDVDLLLRTWPAPKVGDVFPYDAIEKLLGLTHGDNRFRTVTTNWRKRMHEQMGVVVEARTGEAFYVASADDVSARTYSVIKFVGRKAHKHRRKLATVKIESDEQRATIEHQARVMLAIEKDAKRHRMNILPPSPTTQAQPQLAPPKAERKE